MKIKRNENNINVLALRELNELLCKVIVKIYAHVKKIEVVFWNAPFSIVTYTYINGGV